MATRQAIDSRASGMMVFLCAIWGLQQVAIKVVAADIAPILQLSVRSGIAALMIGLLMLVRGEHLSLRDGNWRPGIVVGLLFALEYLLVGEGLRYTSASHLVIFLYTAPIFAALGLHWKFPAERLKPVQWVGIAVAFAGIVTAFSGRTDGPANGDTSAALLGDLLGLLAAVAWGATTLVIRSSRLAQAPTTQTSLYQLLGAFVWLLLAATLSGQTAVTLTPLVWGSMIFQVLLVSFVGFLAWFWLLRVYLASRLGVLSFMTPLYGIFFGVWLLDEPLEFSFIAGALLVLAGIVLVSGYEWLSQLLAGRRRLSEG